MWQEKLDHSTIRYKNTARPCFWTKDISLVKVINVRFILEADKASTHVYLIVKVQLYFKENRS